MKRDLTPIERKIITRQIERFKEISDFSYDMIEDLNIKLNRLDKQFDIQKRINRHNLRDQKREYEEKSREAQAQLIILEKQLREGVTIQEKTSGEKNNGSK